MLRAARREQRGPGHRFGALRFGSVVGAAGRAYVARRPPGVGARRHRAGRGRRLARPRRRARRHGRARRAARVGGRWPRPPVAPWSHSSSTEPSRPGCCLWTRPTGPLHRSGAQQTCTVRNIWGTSRESRLVTPDSSCPQSRGPNRLVPLAALTTENLTEGALRIAANCGWLRAQKGFRWSLAQHARLGDRIQAVAPTPRELTRQLAASASGSTSGGCTSSESTMSPTRYQSFGPLTLSARDPPQSSKPGNARNPSADPALRPLDPKCRAMPVRPGRNDLASTCV